ncbi:hypothetical protein UB51_03950 [Paenibacillus sp. IHBB 10380]|nr:hypothetical protein UB51_03950 [Paenibacillus sp. IHBB 10380]
MNIMSCLLFWLLMKTVKGGGMNMVIVMVSLIIWGDITFEQVPDNSRVQLERSLKHRGLMKMDNP